MGKQHTIYGYHAVTAVLRTHPKTVQLLCMQVGRDDVRAQEIIQLANEHHVPIEEMSKKALTDQLPSEGVHQGVIAICSNLASFSESDLPNLLKAEVESSLLLILDGIQDPHNLGACMRTANAMGVNAIIAPKDKAAGITAAVRKVASGAAELTPFIQVTNLARTMRWLKDQGIWIVGMVTDVEAVLSSIDLTGGIAIVLGSEGKGMRRLTREQCDYLAKIEMQGTIESLNVSVTTGMCLYEVSRQRSYK